MSKLFSGTQGALQINTADIAANAIDGTLTKDALIADYSDVTITASDLIMYGDATDSNNTKRDTVQGILDLAGGGGYEYVTNTSASGASIAFEGQSGNYDYLLVAKSLKPSADAHIDVTFGTGTSYVTANYQYEVFKAQQDAMTSAGNDGSGQAAIRLTIATMGAGSGEYIDGVFEVFNLADANHNTSMFGRYVAEDAGGTEHMMLTGGRYEVNAAQTDIKFSVTTGTFSSGSISLFRRPNA